MLKAAMDIVSLWALPLIILLILTVAVLKKVPVYEAFIEGAKDGVKVTVNIIPYLGCSRFRCKYLLRAFR